MAKREAELKKVQESDSLKAKKIMSLETQLTEARRLVCQSNEGTGSKDTDSYDSKISSLELRTSFLENQWSMLSSKLETSPATTLKLFVCEFCDFTSDSTNKLNNHKINSHEPSSVSPRLQRRNTFLNCSLCDFKATSSTTLQEHAASCHIKCVKCNYFTSNHKDLNRHMRNMHEDQSSAPDCMIVEPSLESQNSCHSCDFIARTKSGLDNHMRLQHNTGHRTRVFSASRHSSHASSTATNHDNLFRPWSASKQLPSSRQVYTSDSNVYGDQ